MPYLKEGKMYNRITEITSYTDCEALAYIDKHYPINRPKRAHAVTLAGTISHHRIAEHELKKNPYKGIAFEFGSQERSLFQKLLMDHQLQKERFTGEETKYEKILANAKKFFENYLVFNDDYPHTPVFVEERRFNEEFMIAGTIDLLATFRLKGKIIKHNLHPSFNIGTKEYFVEDEKGEYMNVLTICDWKSSKSKQPGHPLQLSTYHLMWESNNEFDDLREQEYIINSESFSVLLGERTRLSQKAQQEELALYGKVLPYQFYRYPVDSSEFAKCLVIRTNPRPLTVNIKGEDGIKGRCMFCSDILHCPDISIIPENYRREAITSLETWDLSETRQLLSLLEPVINTDPGKRLQEKITFLHQKLITQKDIFDNKDIDDIVKFDIYEE